MTDPIERLQADARIDSSGSFEVDWGAGAGALAVQEGVSFVVSRLAAGLIGLGGSSLKIQSRRGRIVMVLSNPVRALRGDPVGLALGREGPELRMLGVGLLGAASLSPYLSVVQWHRGESRPQVFQCQGKAPRFPSRPWGSEGAVVLDMHCSTQELTYHLKEVLRRLYFSPIPVTLNGSHSQYPSYRGRAGLEYRHLEQGRCLGLRVYPLTSPRPRRVGCGCPWPGPFVVVHYAEPRGSWATAVREGLQFEEIPLPGLGTLGAQVIAPAEGLQMDLMCRQWIQDQAYRDWIQQQQERIEWVVGQVSAPEPDSVMLPSSPLALARRQLNRLWRGWRWNLDPEQRAQEEWTSMQCRLLASCRPAEALVENPIGYGISALQGMSSSLIRVARRPLYRQSEVGDPTWFFGLMAGTEEAYATQIRSWEEVPQPQNSPENPLFDLSQFYHLFCRTRALRLRMSYWESGKCLRSWSPSERISLPRWWSSVPLDGLVLEILSKDASEFSELLGRGSQRDWPELRVEWEYWLSQFFLQRALRAALAQADDTPFGEWAPCLAWVDPGGGPGVFSDVSEPLFVVEDGATRQLEAGQRVKCSCLARLSVSRGMQIEFYRFQARVGTITLPGPPDRIKVLVDATSWDFRQSLADTFRRAILPQIEQHISKIQPSGPENLTYSIRTISG